MSLTATPRLLAALLLAAHGPPGVAAEPSLAIRADDPGVKWGPCPAIFPAGCEIAVLHGDPSKPDSDVFLRVRGGQALPAHTHTSAERMVLVGGQLRVKYEGAAETTLTPGMYAYGPAKAPHRATCVGDAPCTLFIGFDGPVDAALHSGALD